MTRLADRIAVAPQYLLPKLLLTRAMGRFASARLGGVTRWSIRHFIERYRVDMSEALEPDPAAYRTFNEFFTRALHPRARPIVPTGLSCPVDGFVSQFGRIDGDRILQAKGHDYTVRALLGGDAQAASHYLGGSFATLYLSPRDYHRIHMPCDGRLRWMMHVPGDLFSVNPLTARAVPGLFARNERVIAEFDSSEGRFALVLVGATIVGSIATDWHGTVCPPRPGKIRRWNYRDGEVLLARGAQMGRFLLGSTVIVLFPAPGLEFNPQWHPGRAIRLGEAMAERA